MSEVLHLRPCSWAVQELFSRIWVISRSIFIKGKLEDLLWRIKHAIGCV